MNDWYDNPIWEKNKEENDKIEEEYRVGFAKIAHEKEVDLIFLDLWERGFVSTEEFLQRMEID